MVTLIHFVSTRGVILLAGALGYTADNIGSDWPEWLRQMYKTAYTDEQLRTLWANTLNKQLSE